MKIKVTGCDVCPFLYEYYNSGEKVCTQLDSKTITTNETEYPSWCPLIKQSIIVELN